MLPSPLYTIQSLIDEQTMIELQDYRDTTESTAAKVIGKDKKGRYDNIRKATVKNVRHSDFPDICTDFCKLLEVHRPMCFAEKFEVREFNYLVYGPGDHFVKHQDWLHLDNDNEYSNRQFSTTTLINKSDDLQGGDLLIWDRYGEVHQVELEVGETVIFNSRAFHQVTPVVQGTRESLVAWIYKKR